MIDLGGIFGLTGAIFLIMLSVITGRPLLVGYQAMCSNGVSLMMQWPLHLVLAIVTDKDLIFGIRNLLFIQTFEGAVFVSV